MKTKPIPAIVMLTAGFITCIVAIFQKMELLAFTKTLLLVLIIFYLLGGIAAYILEKNFKAAKDEESSREKRRYIRKVRKRGREKSERRVIIRNRRLWHENSGQRKTVGKLSEKSSI